MGALSGPESPRDGFPSGLVAVLGAGPAGLAAAHEVSRNGVGVHVLERNDYVGGLCATYEFDGFRFDLGGHRWFTKNPELQAWFLRLMEGELVNVERTSRIYFKGKWFDYPLSIPNVVRNIGLRKSVRAMLSYARSAVRDVVSPREPANLREAFTAQFGAQLFETFFRRYSEKVWGRDCDSISADWVSQRSKGLSFFSALCDAVLKRRNVVSLVDEFVYPRAGYQRICERLAEDVQEADGVVQLESPVSAIRYRGPNDFVVSFGEGAELAASDVVSTVPLNHLVRMLTPACPPEVAKAAGSLEFRDLVTVTLAFQRERVTRDTWVYVHDEDIIFARLHEPKNWSPDMVPSPDTTSLVCECFCTVGDEVWETPDDVLVGRVVDDLADRLGFVERGDLIGSRVVRTRFAYPVYDLEYAGKLRVIADFLAEYEGLHVVGRGGTFRYNNADHSIEMGLLLGRALLGGDVDPMLVNTEKEYHEEVRVPAEQQVPASARRRQPVRRV